MQAAKDKLGQTFDSISAKTTINADDAFTNGLIAVQNDAAKVLPASEQAPINNQIDDLLSAVGPDGTISGKSYQALVSKGAPLDRLSNSDDPNVSHYAQQIRSTLDDAMQRSLAESGQTDLLNQLQQARLAYKNLMTVAPLAAKSTTGDISPALLQSRVSQQFQNRAFQGAGPLGDLANIGQAFLKPTRSSGTAERYIGYEKVGSVLGGIGMGVTGHPVEGLMTAASVPAQIVAGRAISALMNSKPVVNRLIANSLAKPAGTPPVNNALLKALGYGAVTPAGNRLLGGSTGGQ